MGSSNVPAIYIKGYVARHGLGWLAAAAAAIAASAASSQLSADDVDDSGYARRSLARVAMDCRPN